MGNPLTVHPELALRLANLTSWHSDWSGLRVAVYGAGVTGFSVADTLVELGADVFVIASQVSDEHRQLLDIIGARLLEVDDLTAVPDDVSQFDPELAVVSPGFRPDHPLVRWTEQRGTALWGDIELAWRLRDKVGRPAEWICITGTNGKTTTTQLAASMILGSGRRVAPAGNIGVPVLDAIRDPQGWDVLVIELSSFQLHWINRNPGGELYPHSSVCLNIADDHYDWHGSASAYRDAKAKVYQNTRVACVYNKADQVTRGMVENADVVEGARAIGFDLGAPGPSDFGIVDGILCDRAFLEDRQHSALELTTLDELKVVGLGAPHAVANVLAAAALARSIGVEPAVIHEAVRTFRIDHHRTEHVATIAEVRWVNDSKATNPHAANASLTSFDSVVWIVGGLLKGVDVDDLVARHATRLSAVIIIGVDRDALRTAFERHAPTLPLFEVDEADTSQVMPAAVRLAADVARPGDVVLLAPAGAAMDQFINYADRGRQFTDAVRELLEGGDDEDPPSPPLPPQP
ncbi:MAG: UDP-N-acetylmuramoyl-L-alanine--D-glutamate ligase [Microbacteriaceae bacterium]